MENEDEFWNAVYAYKDKFQDSPPVIGLATVKYGALIKVINKAIEAGRPVKDWDTALGLEPLPEGAIS